MSRVAEFLVLCALSEVTAAAVVATSRVEGPAGMNVQAALFAALLLGGVTLLSRSRARSCPATTSLAQRRCCDARRSDRRAGCTAPHFTRRLVRLGEPYTVPALTQVLVLGPIAEEVIYRGLLWRGLARRGAGLTATLSLSACAFGLYHLAYWNGRFTAGPLLHVATTIGAGVGFGLLRHWSGGIAVPALAHAAANTAILWMRTAR